MKSHDLARLLLSYPDLPMASYANGHTYMSAKDSDSHGPMRVGTLETSAGQHIVIGNLSKRMINPPNWWISEALGCELADTWETKAYPGLTKTHPKHHTDSIYRMRLYGDGIDRYSTGLVGTMTACVDARGGPPEPQFGGKWCGRCWSADKLLVDTGRVYETFEAALTALNEALVVYDRVVYYEARR